jgi:hypothetical protein
VDSDPKGQGPFVAGKSIQLSSIRSRLSISSDFFSILSRAKIQLDPVCAILVLYLQGGKLDYIQGENDNGTHPIAILGNVWIAALTLYYGGMSNLEEMR